MTWSQPPDNPMDSAHSLTNGVFTAAGIQVKATLGSSYISDVIKVDKTGTEKAIKILTTSASKDNELVNRFLTNARYNQSLGEFTQMQISEIVDSGPRPYYVMERVAQSSLLEVIRLHAPIDPRWLVELLLPIAKTLDTIHQRNVLHANIKPSNLLIVVENNQEKMMLVDYLEPTLAATSATLTGAGVYAAPEFRAGMPVSNRSDIYSLAAIMYEALSATLAVGAYKTPDGFFHVWRPNDTLRELHVVNPEIPKILSDSIMNGLSPQAISRQASASALVEDCMRVLDEPRTRVKVSKPEPEHKPVPMLLIGVGVFVSIILLFGIFKVISSVFSSSKTPSSTTTTQVSTPTTGTATLTKDEKTLLNLLKPENQTCQINRNVGNDKKWGLATAILNCESTGVTNLSYGLFANKTDLESTFVDQKNAFQTDVINAGGQLAPTQANIDPCSVTPNEFGQWGSKIANQTGGGFVCVSSPNPKMIWYDSNSRLYGEATLATGPVSDLVNWWKNKSGPK